MESASQHVLAVYSCNQQRFLFQLEYMDCVCQSVCLSIQSKILEPLVSNEVVYSAVLAHDTCVYVCTGETDQDAARCSEGREGAYQD